MVASARVDLDDQWTLTPERPEVLLALDEAIEHLASEDPVKAELVELALLRRAVPPLRQA